VFIQTSPAVFSLRPVSLGKETAQQYSVLAGLKSGETIVVNGAFHLNNERLRTVLE
jgi:cobalt-zinc-cadmium efflux system membrane fusion protein